MKGEEGITHSGIVPLRTILQNFLNLVENCENKRNGGLDSYDKEFQELKLFSESLKCDSGYLCKEGEKSVNRKKNRYKDILPFDYTRVTLSDYGEVPGSDYINANFIKGASGSSAYIACQGPLPHTVNEFWRMVVECEVQVIVMACNEQESGKHKCENYWVEVDGVERQFGQVSVQLKKCRSVCPDFLVRTLRIHFTNSNGEKEERNVCQFHYSAWPDHGVPTKVRPLLDMVRLIRDCQTSETLPVLVHCSAGCGRTGTICAIDYVWGLLRLGKLTPEFSLFQLVKDMRRQRIAMVQTKDQYILVHRAVSELFQEQLKIIEAHPYANVDQNGLPLEIKAELQEPMYETIDYGQKDIPVNEMQLPDTFSAGKPTGEDCVDSRIGPSTSVSTGLTIPPIKSSPPPADFKVDKENENRCKHEQFRSTDTIGISSQSSAATGTNSSSANANKDKAAHSGKSSRNDVKTSTKSSLLRKPSIVKLKAFFEKSKDNKDKKPGITLLSRAKSDVSSSTRFYSCNNIENVPNQCSNSISKENSPSQSELDKLQMGSSLLPSRFVNVKGKEKPIIMAKPTIPVKRSKSLKIHHGESFDSIGLYGNDVDRYVKEHRPSVSSNSNSNNSSASYSSDPSNPIRVCVKQVEMPKLQKVLSKSIKLEAHHATTADVPCLSDVQRNHLSKSTLNTLTTSKTIPQNKAVKSSNCEKPQIPSRTLAHSMRKNHNYANVTYGSSRIKMGVSKEMEDVRSADNYSAKHQEGKTSESIEQTKTTAPGKIALTRSHSHVWPTEKVTTPVKIYSDDDALHDRSTSYSPKSSNDCRADDTSKSVMGNSVFGNAALGVGDTYFDNSHSLPQNGPSKYIGKTGDEKLLTSIEKPVIRRSVPKTNPYTSYSSGLSKYAGSTSSNNNQLELTSSNLIRKDNTPRIKSSHTNSIGTSSGSSSNSLPSTPTQSIDVLYPQIRNNTAASSGYRNSSGAAGKANSNVPPKSILKESLSSTPSESDEKLDCTRNFLPCNFSSNQLIAPKVNSIRLGIRERRNSFRQAVMKEDQANSPPKSDILQSYPFTGLCPPTSTASSCITSESKSLKTHKDYEAIWPDSNNSKIPFRVGGSKVSTSESDPTLMSLFSNSCNDQNAMTSAYNNSQFPSDDRISSKNTIISSDSLYDQPKTKNRVEEIKLLLEERKASVASGVTSSSSMIQNMQKYHPKPNVILGTSLRHQRSLRVPSKSQNPQSMSCFTFRKPTSFESITDHINAEEEYYPFVKQSTSQFYNVGSERNLRSSDNLINDRKVNDYVKLEQCRTITSEQQQSSSTDSSDETSPNRRYGPPSQGSYPVPPPRTKKSTLQDNCRRFPSKQPDFKHDAAASSSSFWGGNQASGGSSTAVPIASVLENNNRSAKIESHNTSNEEGLLVEHTDKSTSPKVIVRALGLFQGVRSRFSNWTDKDSHTKKNDLTNQDTTDSRLEQNFAATQSGNIAGPSWSKQQYL